MAAATPLSAFERVSFQPSAAQLFRRISHDKRTAGEGQHFNIVIVITNGHDLLAGNAAVIGPALERVSLGAAGIEHIDNGKIAARVLGAQNGDGQAAASRTCSARRMSAMGPQNMACTGSVVSAFSIGTTNWMYCMFFSSQRLMLPSSLSRRSITMRARAFAVKCKNGLTAKFLHRAYEFAAGRLGEQVAVESFSGERAGDGAVGTDQPKIEPQLLSDGQGKGVAASGDQDDLDALGVCVPEGCEIGRGNLEFRVEQGAVNIDGNEAERIGGHR